MCRIRLFRFLVVLAATLAVTLAAGCRSIGPATMDRDQLDYGQSIGNNWKNQMLTNIVKMRYADMPVFVDVGSIVSGYSFETQLGAEVNFNESIIGSDTVNAAAGGRFTDRPTITYKPKTGDDYLRSLLKPVEPHNLLALIQAGYNADILFTWAVEAINDVHNYSATVKERMKPDPEYYELTGLLRELQSGGLVAWELETDPETRHEILLVVRRDDPSDEVRAKRERLAEILKLDININRYRVMYAPFMTSPDTLAIQTRSITQMLRAMAGFIDVPPERTAHATPGFQVRIPENQPFRVHSGSDRPDHPYAAVKYKDYWYWIEETDITSKRVFVMMLFLTTLTNRSDPGMGPVLTIPTG